MVVDSHLVLSLHSLYEPSDDSNVHTLVNICLEYEYEYEYYYTTTTTTTTLPPLLLHNYKTTIITITGKAE